MMFAASITTAKLAVWNGWVMVMFDVNEKMASINVKTLTCNVAWDVHWPSYKVKAMLNEVWCLCWLWSWRGADSIYLLY